MSTLFIDPNPLAKAEIGTGGFVEAVMTSKLMATPPPVNNQNPLSVAQYNGYVEGAAEGGARGFILGAALGLLCYYAVTRLRSVW